MLKLSNILDRLREPSTYAGLAAVAVGAGQVFDISEAPAVAEAIGAAGATVTATGDPIMGGAALFFGLLAMFMRERGRK